MRPRILSLGLDGVPATLTLRGDSSILAVGDSHVSSYDLLGRPYVVVRDGATYRRALDGRVLEKRPADGGAPRLRMRLAPSEAGPVLDRGRSEAESALAGLGRGDGDEGRAEARRRLKAIVAMDAAALAADAERFRATYGRVGVLPPDQYLAVVLQATQGCSWNACTFCELYRGIPFRARAPDEFAQHVADVRAYFGRSLALRRSVFIGDANALCLPHERLLPLLQLAAGLEPAAGGLFAFVDMWTGHRTSVDEYRDYARLGLRRVYVGLETGDPRLLAWLGKPGPPQHAVDLVARLHAAGIAVAVIVLLGAGGDRFDAAHARSTAEVLTRMQLLQDDLVYFSEMLVPPGSVYARRAQAEGVRALAAPGLSRQRAVIGSFRPANRRRPPRRVSYDLREFIY
jgi:hypothetical protein